MRSAPLWRETVQEAGPRRRYDLTVADAASGFARRLAGRLETGRDGISDPAMATELD